MLETEKIDQTINKNLISHENSDHYSPSVRLLQVQKASDGSCGFHLSRSKWDPYPWVSAVDMNTPAEITGLKTGDCVLEVNGEDILGLKITEVASLVKQKSDIVSMLVWSTGGSITCDPESICCGPLPINLERLSASMQTILSALECPVCMETIPPPVIQCQNGHLLCTKCSRRSEKCPVCRDRFTPIRSLIAERIYHSVTDAFNLKANSDGKLREQLFGGKCHHDLMKTTLRYDKNFQSPTNKFLAKLMGKASSLESLKDPICLEIDNIIKSKQLSVSANDLPKSQQPVMTIQRCPSAGRNDKANNVQIFKKRPTSLNSSIENLNNSENSLSIPVPKLDISSLYYCPLNSKCEKIFNEKSLCQHIMVQHNTPIILFKSSSAEISIPLRAPIEKSPLILVLDNKQFWVKLWIDGDGSIFTSALLQGQVHECSKYMLQGIVRNKVIDKLLQKELIMRSIVHSLTRTSWNDVLDRRLGIFYDPESIRTMFINGSELMLRVDIKRRDE